ncbi:hypothetical protein [Microbulbifer yueqingensis]|uniref:DUF3108 domain-containing protein n=1 Tax=Microbulbifer yueqingensis TaxID=658219 RepID=A0A1G8ZAR7_9GAMM|nr:hypothetical protein [Microbulbifer yueqingensis]SDK12216.1 hypothetical protein SAMN05216212_1545 [Microbulbifer yueqingensis]
MLNLIGALALNTAVHCGYEGEVRAIGLARQPGSGELVYCEYHLPARGQRSRVLYYSPAGHRIAEKKLESRGGGSPHNTPRPQVRQQDYRHGEERQVLWKGSVWQLRYRQAGGASWESARLEAHQADVVDAGFDAFVRQNWSRLAAGEPVEFSFASPLHGRAVTLRARKVTCKKGGQGTLCLQVDLAQPLLRLFAGNLYLVYGVGNRQLRTFDGIVNLLDSEGESQRLRIDYHYP